MTSISSIQRISIFEEIFNFFVDLSPKKVIFSISFILHQKISKPPQISPFKSQASKDSKYSYRIICVNFLLVLLAIVLSQDIQYEMLYFKLDNFCRQVWFGRICIWTLTSDAGSTADVCLEWNSHIRKWMERKNTN